ncbi:hypothetical protein OED52_13645 [Rhodococcus sp. Z13]|uniref:Uncharacterized protein n=1 Tax=Rhodococcus sacchari TaxID=2962047 RepID=A0ACD4DCA5_9NOCA|nr:hypothetical protein [Rhodococcus sp. Z13]UYP17715.1 hypothetical protein OED52_13645 [Rhodococcus sp. Z13]
MSCNWPVDRSCLPEAETPEEWLKQRHAEDLAVSVLWALSGRQFGQCPVIARPCPTPCPSLSGYSLGPGRYPLFDDGRWLEVNCGCYGACEASGPTVIHLPGPVGEIAEVKIEGIVLDEAAYRLEGDRLYRTDGKPWPHQNLLAPLDSDGTWSVTYTRGHPVPAGVGTLVGLLTKEFLAACSGGKCRLPRRVQSVSRQGVTYQMVDPTDIYASGKTGIPEIDLWLSSVNPIALQQRPVVR